MAASLGLTVAAWSPLGAGVLTGKYNKRSDEDKRLDKSQLRPVTDRDLRIAAVVCDVAKDVGRSPAQVALAWLCSNPNVIPIIGARKHEQLLDNMACLDLTLSEDHLRRLDEVSAIDLGFPGEFLARPFIRGLVHGQLWDSLDRPIRQPAVAAAKTQPAAEKRVEAVKLEEALAR